MTGQSKPYAPLTDRAGSTTKNYVSGERDFNKFAEAQGERTLDEWTYEQLTENSGINIRQALSSFASYLLSFKKTDGSHIKPDVQGQYLSNAKSFLVNKFKKMECGVPPVLDEKTWHHEWYTDLRVSL